MKGSEGPETIDEFYRNRPGLFPYGSKNGQGQFNVFDITQQAPPLHNNTDYRRKDFYKIKMLEGHFIFHYADKSIEINGTALIFVHPYIPYKFEFVRQQVSGYLCIFREEFLSLSHNTREYPVYQPGSNPCFILAPENINVFSGIYRNMQAEIRSDYRFKYDLLRAYLLELMHKAMKLRPAEVSVNKGSNANTRIYLLFAELLELQFPVEAPLRPIKLRSPEDFADQLSVHINHLNRAIKQTTGRTTSMAITERLLLEAKGLLSHTNWNISEIASCLGFEDTSYFIRLFKNHAGATPGKFREQVSAPGQQTPQLLRATGPSQKSS